MWPESEQGVATTSRRQFLPFWPYCTAGWERSSEALGVPTLAAPLRGPDPLAHLQSELPPVASDPYTIPLRPARPRRLGCARNRDQFLFGIDQVEDGKDILLRLHLGQFILWWRTGW